MKWIFKADDYRENVKLELFDFVSSLVVLNLF